MNQDRKIKDLKTLAKKIARSKRIERHEALDMVAQERTCSSSDASG